MSKAPPTFNYPGSKTTIAPWILEYIPEHTTYIEPFGGAASLLVAKPRSDIEVYNDLNSDCVDFFRAVRDHPDELARWVENTPYSRELFEEYVEEYQRGEWPDDLVERAGRFMFTQNASFGGMGVMKDSPSFSVNKKHPNASHNSFTWHDRADSIQRLRDRFQSVQIESLDYADLVEKYDHEDAFFYFDPPYVDVGDRLYKTEDGGFDHSRFVNTLHDIEGRWLVSYDDNLPAGLEDYRTISRKRGGNISNTNTDNIETLTMNYDLGGEKVMSEYGQRGLDAFAD